MLEGTLCLIMCFPLHKRWMVQSLRGLCSKVPECLIANRGVLNVPSSMSVRVC